MYLMFLFGMYRRNSSNLVNLLNHIGGAKYTRKKVNMRVAQCQWTLIAPFEIEVKFMY